MFQHLPIAAVLVAATVAVHATGFGIILSRLLRTRHAPPSGTWPITRLLIGMVWLLIFLHLIEISLWASFYWWKGLLTDAESSFYFSGVTYTTLGYGDLVLPYAWRLLAPIEGLTGILMSGLSAGLLFAIVTAIYLPRRDGK